MKQETKQFNFNLPEELKEYLDYRSTSESSTISQCIIDLVKKDKENRAIDFSDIDVKQLFSSAKEVIAYTIKSILKESSLKDVCHAHETYSDDSSIIYREWMRSIREQYVEKIKTIGKGKTCVICHSDLRDVLQDTLKDVEFFFANCPELLYNVIISYDNKVHVHCLEKSELMKIEVKDEHGDGFFDKKTLDQYRSFIAKREKSQYRIIQKVMDDGTSRFYPVVFDSDDPKNLRSVSDWKKNNVFENLHEAKCMIWTHKQNERINQRFNDVLRGSLASKIEMFDEYESAMFRPMFRPQKEWRIRTAGRQPISQQHRIEVEIFVPMDSPEYRQVQKAETWFAPNIKEEIVHEVNTHDGDWGLYLSELV